MRAVFNIEDANDDHLASFPTSTSTVYSHVLVLTWGSVKYYSHIIHCLVTVVSDTVHACLGTGASTLHLYRAWVHRNCAREPSFQADSGTDGEPCPSMTRLCLHPSNELDFCGSTASGPLVWKNTLILCLRWKEHWIKKDCSNHENIPLSHHPAHYKHSVILEHSVAVTTNIFTAHDVRYGYCCWRFSISLRWRLDLKRRC